MAEGRLPLIWEHRSDSKPGRLQSGGGICTGSRGRARAHGPRTNGGHGQQGAQRSPEAAPEGVGSLSPLLQLALLPVLPSGHGPHGACSGPGQSQRGACGPLAGSLVQRGAGTQPGQGVGPRLGGGLSTAHGPGRVTSCRPGQRQASGRGCFGGGMWPGSPRSWLRTG